MPFAVLFVLFLFNISIKWISKWVKIITLTMMSFFSTHLAAQQSDCIQTRYDWLVCRKGKCHQSWVDAPKSEIFFQKLWHENKTNESIDFAFTILKWDHSNVREMQCHKYSYHPSYIWRHMHLLWDYKSFEASSVYLACIVNNKLDRQTLIHILRKTCNGGVTVKRNKKRKWQKQQMEIKRSWDK